MAPKAVEAGTISSWTNITNNGNADVGTQLQAVYTDFGTGVQFVFTNNVGIASVITDIYFDDSASPAVLQLNSLVVFAQSAGVSFSQGASPPNLPGGNTLGFNVTAGLSADSDPPAAPNGINAAGESLTLRINYATGATFTDVENAINSGALRIGLHVQAIAPQGGSDSYVNTAVPEPATLGLLGMGCSASPTPRAAAARPDASCRLTRPGRCPRNASLRFHAAAQPSAPCLGAMPRHVSCLRPGGSSPPPAAPRRRSYG